MDIRKLLGFDTRPQLRLPRQFPVKLTRLENEIPQQIEATVTGYYVARKGKADFVAEKITAGGSPDSGEVLCTPKEMAELKKYAMSVEYPKMLGLKI